MLRIISDTGSDMTIKEANEKNITLIPLNIVFGDEPCACLTDEDRDIFFEKLANCKELPKTSQPSPSLYEAVFNEAKEAGDEVIVLSLSAGLSGTYQSACIAKDMVDYDKITVIDTGSVTLGQRLLIDRAAKMRDAGATCVDIVNMVNEVKDKIVVCGVVNTLEYLKKGGRIPPMLAGIGTALKIKPALMIKDGVIIELAKSRGMKQGIQKVYAEYERMGVNPDWPVYFGYVNDIKPTQDMIDDMAPKYNIEKYSIYPVGPTIGVHVGPGCVLATFVRG